MTALGVDVGTVRVGIATSVGTVAIPAEVIDVADVVDGAAWSAEVAARIHVAAEARDSDVIVVGLPRGMSGRDTAAAQRVRRVAAALTDYGHRVELVDERLTSVEAERVLREAGRSGRGRRGSVDPVAASIVLQHWLDMTAVGHDDAPPGGRRGRR